MLSTCPKGYVPGHLFPNPLRTSTAAYRSLKEDLETRFLLASDSYLHFDELKEASEGKRSLPGRDMVIYNWVKYTLEKAIDPEGKIHAQDIGRYRTPKQMHRKLNLFLLSTKEPILMHPRNGQVYNIVYITYCCAMLDPHNCTQWCDCEPVSTENIDGYPGVLWKEKAKAFKRITELGYDGTNERMHNAYLAIYHHSLNRDKYAALTSSNKSNEGHVNYYVSFKRKAELRVRQLSIACFIRLKSKKDDKILRSAFMAEFKRNISIAASLNPFVTTYPPTKITIFFGHSIGGQYDVLQRLGQRLDRKTVSLENSMKKKVIKTGEMMVPEYEDDPYEQPMVSSIPKAGVNTAMTTTFTKRTNRGVVYKTGNKEVTSSIRKERASSKTLPTMKLAQRHPDLGNFI